MCVYKTRNENNRTDNNQCALTVGRNNIRRKIMIRQGDITGFDDAEVVDVETEEEKKDSTE